MRVRACQVIAWIVIYVVVSAHCERLPIRAYTMADGLPSNDINSITRDSRGILWFATNEGLSQFDGYEFRTYGQANGLPRDAIVQLLETRRGVYWAATFDGVARFDPNAPASGKFRIYRPGTVESRRVYVLYEDHAGELWCGTEGGLFRLRAPSASTDNWIFESVPLLPSSGKPAVDIRVISLFEDSRGDLWIGTFRAIYRRTRDGRIFEYVGKPRIGVDFLWNVVLEDTKGRLWAGTGYGLWRIVPDTAGEFRVDPVYVPPHRIIVTSILEDSAGDLQLGTSAGLLAWKPEEALSSRPRVFAEENGVANHEITALCMDREGNLWLGSTGGGAMRVAKNGFLSYSPNDLAGFQRYPEQMPTLFRDRAGDVHVAFHHVIEVLRGDRFLEIVPAIPKQHSSYLGWGWHQTVVQDKTGEWWIPTAEGVVRFPSVPVERLGHTRPKAVYTTRNGLRTNDIFRIFEDSAGGIWVACIGPLGLNGLSRWDRSTASFRHFTDHTNTVVTAFAEDRDGSIWMGDYEGAIARYRNGSFAWFGPKDGVSAGRIQALLIDHLGRLWIAASRGLLRIDVPTEAHPKFLHYGISDGLSSNVERCITEDARGRVYVATGKGIDRIPSNGRIAPGQVKHFTEADGLAGGDIRDVLFDRHGVLWCASRQGISRLQPEIENPEAPPPVLLRELRVRGAPYWSWDLGASKVPNIVFGPEQNQLQITYAGLAFAPGDVLAYQYRLDPSDQDWSEPGDERAVNYSNLAPGTYRFRVRLITGQLVAGEPAELDFTIRAPIWQRWWFRLLMTLVVVWALYWLHRYRTMRIVELERVRTRIATDLHDDIGSGLSQIAILSEVARTRVDEVTPDLKEVLSRIGSVSRELTDGMSDIVWSVNPQRDHLADLVQRMRRFASDVLGSGGIEIHFHAPSPDQPMRIASEIRREVYLIFKEIVNNAARHSHCTRVDISIIIDHRVLILTVQDNGAGFCERDGHAGNGLRNIQERANRIGAHLEIKSGEAGGLQITLRVPISRSRPPEQVGRSIANPSYTRERT